MDIINFICDIISSPVSWLAWMPFLFGYEWIPKTETDEVVEEHVNELQDKKVDKDADRIGAGGITKPVETLDINTGIKLHDRTPQAVVTFTIDDNREDTYTDWKDLFDSKSISGVASLNIDAYAGLPALADNLEEWIALQAAGWEIASHSKTHANLVTLSEEQIEDEVGDSKTLLESLGFTIRNFCYPGGQHNVLVRKIVRKYYLGALAVDGYPIHTHPFIMDELPRPSGDDLTLGELKDIVDEAIVLGGWITIMLHAADAGKLTKIGDLIDYIQGLDVQILTMSEAEDLIGNLVDSQHFKVSAEGEVKAKLPILQNLCGNSKIGVWSRSDANKGLCTIAYDNGDKGGGAAPSVGDACVGANGATGKVISYTTTLGSWALGTAEGVLTLGACTGSWTDNEGLTFDGVETALVNGEDIGICNDPCNNDGTADWTDPDAILSDNVGEYLVTTDAINEKAYLTGLTFTEGKIYKVEAQLKDGTASPTDIELVSLNGAVVEKASAKIDTTGAFVTYSLTFEATADTDGVGIRTPTSLAGSNIQMRYFICYEITPCYTAVNNYAGLDEWGKNASMHLYREHKGANTKGGSFYALKCVPTVADDYIRFPGVYVVEEYVKYLLRTITFGAWVKAFKVSHAHLALSGGGVAAYIYSRYHTGGGDWEWLEVTKTVPASGLDLVRAWMFNLAVTETDGSSIVYISQPTFVFGSGIGEGNYIPRQEEWVQLEKPIPLNRLHNKTGFSNVAWADLNIEAESEGMIPKEAKALLIGGSVNDGGSAGGDCYLVFRKDATLAEQLYFSSYGLANDAIHRGEGIINLDADGDLDYKIVATAATFDIPRLLVYAVKVTD